VCYTCARLVSTALDTEPSVKQCACAARSSFPGFISVPTRLTGAFWKRKCNASAANSEHVEICASVRKEKKFKPIVRRRDTWEGCGGAEAASRDRKVKDSSDRRAQVADSHTRLPRHAMDRMDYAVM